MNGTGPLHPNGYDCASGKCHRSSHDSETSPERKLFGKDRLQEVHEHETQKKRANAGDSDPDTPQSTIGVKQPTGTTHFQFLPHQLPLPGCDTTLIPCAGVMLRPAV
jgi:hypothetical protein